MPSKLPKKFFHYTHKENLSDIRKSGLRAVLDEILEGGPGGDLPGVNLLARKSDLPWPAQSHGTWITIDPKDLKRDKFNSMGLGWWRYNEDIPVDYLRFLEHAPIKKQAGGRVDPRLPVAPWELSSRDRYSTHWGSYGQESPATDPERWSPPPEDRGLSALRGLSRAVTDLALPLTLPLDTAHAFMKDKGFRRFAGDPYFPAQAAVERWWSKNAERQAPPAAPEMTALRDDPLTPEMAVRLANPAAWFQALHPLRAARELAAVPGTALRGLGRLAAEGVERGVQGAGPLAALRGAVAPMNVVRDPGGQFSPVQLDRALEELSPRGPFEGWPGEYKKVDPPLRMPSGRGLNWLNQRTGQYLNDAEYRQLVENTQRTEPLHRWINTQLRRYVARDLGSERDPILDMARRGAPLHMTPETLERAAELPYGSATMAEALRLQRGLPEVSQIPWESAADAALYPTTAKREIDIVSPITNLSPEKLANQLGPYKFLQGLPPDTPMWTLRQGALSNLGFDHVRDVLAEDLAAGRLRPESLGRMSVEQAVRRTAEYDAELAKRMGAAAARREAEMPVLKAYPQAEGQEKPWRWVELNKPGAFADESDRMGHSVRGYEPTKGFGDPTGMTLGAPPGMSRHPDWVPESGTSGRANYGHGGWDAIKEGRARVLSLRGPDGKSYATVEIARSPLWRDFRGLRNDPQLKPLAAMSDKEIKTTVERLTAAGLSRSAEHNPARLRQTGWYTHPDVPSWIVPESLTDPVSRITQIKGPQNQAPAAEALPYIQDLVRNLGPWEDYIGDFGNTGLTKILGEYRSKEELDQIKKLVDKFYEEQVEQVPTTKELFFRGVTPDKREFENSVPKKEALVKDMTRFPRILEEMKRRGYWPEFAGGGAVIAPRPGLDDIISELYDPPLERLVEEAFA